MEMDRQDILDRLMRIDSDMALLDPTPNLYSCVLVGGSALVVMKKIYRSHPRH